MKRVSRSVFNIKVNIKDKRKYQDIVLIVDRPDFLMKITYIKAKILVHDNYSPSGDIKKIMKEYALPNKLESVIESVVIKGKVTDTEVMWYEPGTHPQKEPLKGYLHPILGVMLSSTIKRDREWYLLNKSGIGYPTLSIKFNVPQTTVQTAINSYKSKLKIEI